MSRYDPARGHRRDTAWWDDYDGELKVFDMSWFINKGGEVTEDVPYTRKYHKVWKTADGPRQTVAQDILVCQDEGGRGAPVYKDGSDMNNGAATSGASASTATAPVVAGGIGKFGSGVGGGFADGGAGGTSAGATAAAGAAAVPAVRHLARLKADLSCIPQSELMQRVGRDGKMYYVVYYEIEMTYLSACTRYALVYKGVRYDSVSAEYV